MIDPREDLQRTLAQGASETFARYHQKALGADLHSLVETPRLHVILTLLLDSLALEGDTIECGVYKGGGSALIAQALEGSGKRHYLCDSFQGLPEHGEQDNYHRVGDFADTSQEAVRQGLVRLGVQERTQIVSGWFSETLPTLEDKTFCFAHVDADYYESTWQCLMFLYPRMAAGGWIVLDDYVWHGCEGVRSAVDRFFADKPETVLETTGFAAAVRRERGGS